MKFAALLAAICLAIGVLYFSDPKTYTGYSKVESLRNEYLRTRDTNTLVKLARMAASKNHGGKAAGFLRELAPDMQQHVPEVESIIVPALIDGVKLEYKFSFEPCLFALKEYNARYPDAAGKVVYAHRRVFEGIVLRRLKGGSAMSAMEILKSLNLRDESYRKFLREILETDYSNSDPNYEGLSVRPMAFVGLTQFDAGKSNSGEFLKYLDDPDPFVVINCLLFYLQPGDHLVTACHKLEEFVAKSSELTESLLGGLIKSSTPLPECAASVICRLTNQSEGMVSALAIELMEKKGVKCEGKSVRKEKAPEGIQTK